LVSLDSDSCLLFPSSFVSNLPPLFLLALSTERASINANAWKVLKNTSFFVLQRDLREPSSFFSVARISSVVARQVAEVEAVLVYPPEAAARLEPPAADLVAGRDLDDCMFFYYYLLSLNRRKRRERETTNGEPKERERRVDGKKKPSKTKKTAHLQTASRVSPHRPQPSCRKHRRLARS
jgi:hypothetical protein